MAARMVERILALRVCALFGEAIRVSSCSPRRSRRASRRIVSVQPHPTLADLFPAFGLTVAGIAFSHQGP